MAAQIVIGTIGNAPQLAPSEGEEILKIRGRLGIEDQFIGIVISCTEILLLQSDGTQKVVTVASPVIKPFKIGTGLAEKLQFHLLEFTNTEDEVARGDLIPEALAHLADAEGQFFPGSTGDIGKVYKDALCGLRAEIHGVFRIFGNTLERFEHQIELSDIGKIMLSAGGARNAVLVHIFFHLRL